jgi:hypothetical protein
MLHYVYKITFKTTLKTYIGMTSKSPTERIHKHYLNSIAGIDSHLYRAIRLYGISDCLFETLSKCESQEEALRLEKEFIKENDSIANGYNESQGGVGGWCVPDHKLNQWKQKISKRSKGKKNPNANAISNEEILEYAMSFFKSNDNRLIRARWTEYSKENGLPLTYTKYRFGGGYQNFLESFKKFLSKNGIDHNKDSFALTKDERYNEEVNLKISNTIKQRNEKNAKNQ